MKTFVALLCLILGCASQAQEFLAEIPSESISQYYGSYTEGETEILFPAVSFEAFIPTSIPVLCTAYYSTDLVHWTRITNTRNHGEAYEDTSGHFYFACIRPGGGERAFFKIASFLDGAPALSRDLSLNMSGEDVADLQAWLLQKGFLKEPYGSDATISTVTSTFEDNTWMAVAALQSYAGITPVNGVCNAMTRTYILAHP